MLSVRRHGLPYTALSLYPPLVRLLPIAVVLCLLGCGQSSKAPTETEAAKPKAEVAEPDDGLVPAGDLRADQTVIKFAVYGMPGGGGEVLRAAEEIHKKDFPRLNLATTDVAKKTPSVLLVAPPMSEFAPPAVDRLRYFGRGLTEAQAQGVQASREAVVMAFAGTKGQSAALHRDALRMTAAVAVKTGGLIWDEDTGQLLSQAAWKKRLSADPAHAANLGQHFAVRSYREGNLVRLVSFGMSKFGLPDITIEEVPVASASAMGNLLNLVAARLVAKPQLEKRGEVTIELSKLGIELPKGAQGRIVLNLARAEPKEGHPENRTVAVIFPGGADTLHERQAKVLAKITGARDELKRSPMDLEIIEARQQAQEELAALQPAFAGGLAKHEMLLVKAPFPTLTGGQEWMWVEIQGWEGKKIKGILQNDPQLTKGLKAGSAVEVNQALVMDYIHKKADGTIVGNATAKILERKESEAMHGWDAGDPKKAPKLGEATVGESP